MNCDFLMHIILILLGLQNVAINSGFMKPSTSINVDKSDDINFPQTAVIN